MRPLIIVAGIVAGLLGPAAAVANENLTYTYDARGRLKQVSHSGSVNNGIVTTYGHDKANNRTNKTTTGAP